MKIKIENYNKNNILTICLAILLVIATIIAVLNVVAMSQIKKITYGMTYEEVVDVLGEMMPSNLSGFAKNEWRLANGDTIWICFGDYNEKTGKYVVSGYFVE